MSSTSAAVCLTFLFFFFAMVNKQVRFWVFEYMYLVFEYVYLCICVSIYNCICENLHACIKIRKDSEGFIIKCWQWLPLGTRTGRR